MLHYSLKKTIDYRTQASAAGHNAVADGKASRALKELGRSRSANFEVGRRHSPIINILVEIS